MPKIEGRLVEAILAEKNSLAVLIIDEDMPEKSEKRKATHGILADRAKVVGACCHNRKPLFVEISFCPWNQNEANFIEAENVLTFQKREANAFETKNDGDDLDKLLKKHKIEVLVIMGFHVNACVLTTIGASIFSALNNGALQHNYRVMTCEQILRGNDQYGKTPKDWNFDIKGMEFYTQV